MKIKTYRNNSAISPVLSSLLLSVIAVGAMAIATTATYVISNNMHDVMGERFILEDAWFKPDGTIGIYIRNVGKVSIEIVSIYINHSTQNFVPVELDVDEHRWIYVSYIWDSMEIINIKLVTHRGNQHAQFFQAPP